MSTLVDRGRPPARAAGDVRPPFLAPAVLAALRAAAGGVVPVAVPVVIAWVLGAGGQATWAQAVRLSLGLWLLAHRTGLTISGGHVGLVPLGLTLVPLISTWYAGRWLARALDPRAERIAAGATRSAPVMPPRAALVAFAGAYGVLGLLASLAAGMPGMRPVSAQAVLGTSLVALVGGGFGAATYRFRTPRAALREIVRRGPAAVRPWLRPAAAAGACQLGAGAVLVAVLIGVHFSGVTALHRALEPGVSGTAVLTLGEVLLLPDLVIWACAALAGPGFAIGTGTAVTLSASRLGPLPAIPVLAALPAPGPLPGAALVLLAVPLLSGVVAGVVVVRRAVEGGLAARLGHAAGAAGVWAVGATLLAWLASGPAGPGRLSDVGPVALRAGLAAGAWVGAGAVLAVLVAAGVPAGGGALRDLVSGRRPGARPAASAAAPADGGRTAGGTAAGPGA